MNRDFASEIEILKKTNSDLNTTVIDKDTQISILNKDIERFKIEKTDVLRNLNSTQTELRDRCDKLRNLEITLVSYFNIFLLDINTLIDCSIFH